MSLRDKNSRTVAIWLTLHFGISPSSKTFRHWSCDIRSESSCPWSYWRQSSQWLGKQRRWRSTISCMSSRSASTSSLIGAWGSREQSSWTLRECFWHLYLVSIAVAKWRSWFPQWVRKGREWRAWRRRVTIQSPLTISQRGRSLLARQNGWSFTCRKSCRGLPLAFDLFHFINNYKDFSHICKKQIFK